MNARPVSLKRNYIASTFSLIVSIIIPLATTPYVSRILHEEGVGQYSFSYSIISYFLIFASLGFGIYSSREIARIKDDRKNVSVVFWEIFFIKLLTSFFSFLVCILLYFLGVYGKYGLFILIFSIEILANGVDISFLYSGLEKFTEPAIINTLSRILGLVAVFLFVKNETDTWIYCLSVSGPLLLSNCVMWIYVRKIIDPISISLLHPTRHILPSLKLFIPTIATTIYTMLDKTIIGLLAANPDYANGCYEQAYKIVRVLYVFCSAVTPVMVPRNSFDYEKGNIDQIKTHVKRSLQYIFLFSIPIILGIQVLADNICGWFLGSGFSDSPNLLRILSGMILLASLTYFLGSGLLVPLKKDGWFTISVCAGAIVNTILNCALIPFYGAYGASVGTVISEFIILCLMLFELIKKDKIITLKDIFLLLYKYLIAGCLMFISIFFLFPLFENNVLTFAYIVAIGASIYFAVLYIEKDSFLLFVLSWIKIHILRRKPL